jgi:hypothetical protein
MPGASIRIFLPTGSPDGVRLVTKSHWTGLAIASPRSAYAEARVARKEFRTPGVYVLAGPPEDATHEARVYVGESDDTRPRIDTHHANKDFWNRLVVFTSVGDGLNKATIRYLEARLLQLAAEAGRAELDNGTAPPLPYLSEPDREDAEAFLNEMLVIYQLLGVNVFEPLEESAAAERLYIQGPAAKGEGAETEDGGFVVFSNARARAQAVDSMPGWALNLRDELQSSGVLVTTQDGASLRLTADHKFSSPSAAAAVLLGRSAAGPEEWKDANGKTLKQIRAEAVSDSGPPADFT